MRYCFFKMGLDQPGVNAWFGGMYRAMFEAMRRRGDEVVLSMDRPDASADVLVVPLGGGQDRTSAGAMAAFDGPVVIYPPSAHTWFRDDYLGRWADRIVMAYNADASDRSQSFYRRAEIPFVHLPFASDPDVMRPIDMPPSYDVVFVGNANSGTGRHRFMDALVARVPRERILLVGPGWERYGGGEPDIEWGPRLNEAYARARVCVNLHNDVQSLGEDTQIDANNRLFDLAMAGRPQVSNAPAIVERYFSSDEVLALAEPDEWADAVVMLIEDVPRATALGAAAGRRAMRQHTWDARAETLADAVTEALRAPRRHVGASARAVRPRDTLLPPYGPAEFAAKVRRRVSRLTGGGTR